MLICAEPSSVGCHAFTVFISDCSLAFPLIQGELNAILGLSQAVFFFSILLGTPAAIQLLGINFLTTDLAPMVEPEPILAPGSIRVSSASHTCCPIITLREGFILSPLSTS
ncbi:hypothetical protein D3C79_873060 [compost metagenome]